MQGFEKKRQRAFENKPTHPLLCPPTHPPSTNTPTATNTPTTAHGTPTYTPFPRSTPEPTETPDPGCTNLGCTLDMPSNDFGAGETCFCHVHVGNTTGSTLIPVFAILDVYGSLFFAPTFNNFDYYDDPLPSGETIIEVISSFPWPSGVGSATDIRFCAAMTNPGMTELYGDMDSYTFGWH